MSLTSEQQAIVDHVVATPGLTMVSAIAGSGKTHLLVAIAQALKATSGLYLAYNKSIATEASRKFPKSINCLTTHSLAYKPTVVEHNLSLSSFSYRDITDRVTYEQKLDVVESIRQFNLSKHLTFETYADEYSVTSLTASLCKKYLTNMEAGTTPCSHDFYLKMFHILLHTGSITYDEFDIIMLDEAGDLNEVTLEIFKLLPAERKVMVGDQHQNIYTFNHTINCFEVMKSEGASFPMSQSFRVSDVIAERIQGFCRTYMDPDMSFLGVPISDPTITTVAYISRTNAALIDTMMTLNSSRTPYGLTRTAKQIFNLPLILCGLKPNGFISDAEYKHLQEDVNEFYSSDHLMDSFKNPLAYIKSQHPDDIQLNTALSIVFKHGKPAIMQCYEEARKHERTSARILLGTAHSMKGLEVDEVNLLNDLNDSISTIVDKLNSFPDYVPTVEERTSLNLYYVACSRAKKVLNGARYL